MAINNTKLNAFTLSTPDAALQQRIDDAVSGIGFVLQNTAGINAIQQGQLQDIADDMMTAGLEDDALALTQFAQTSFNLFLLSAEMDDRDTFETIERIKPELTFHELNENGQIALKTPHNSELTGTALEAAIANEAMIAKEINNVIAANPELAEVYAGNVRLADTFDESTYKSSGPTEHALDSMSFLVTDPTSNPEFLAFARTQDDVSTRALDAYAHIATPYDPKFLALAEAAYNAEHGPNAWVASMGEKLEGLATASALSQGSYTLDAETAMANITGQLVRYGLQSDAILKDPAFLKAAEADWNALNAPKTWAEHVEERRAELKEAAENQPWYDFGEDNDLPAYENFDPKAELSAWARDGNIRTTESLAQNGMDNLWKNEDFLTATEKNYNAIHTHSTEGPKTLAEYIEVERSRLETAAQIQGLGADPRAQVALANFNPNKYAAEWGLAHIQSIQGNLDFSGAFAYGLDPDVFKGLDAQSQVADNTIEDRTTTIGAAYLNAAEIVYNEQNGKGAWAKYVHGQGWDVKNNPEHAKLADAALAAKGESLVGWMLEDNVTTAVVNYFTASDKAKVGVLYLQQLHAYKESSWGDLGNSILRGTVDPSMWVGIASGGTVLSARIAAQLAMRNTGKYVLSRAIASKVASTAIGASVGGMIEGAITEGALVYGQQQTGMDVDVRKDYDFRSIMISAGMGGGLGAFLGGAMGSAGHVLARSINFRAVRRSIAKADISNRSASFQNFENLIARAEEAADAINANAEPTPAQLKAFTDVTEDILYFDTSKMSDGELAYARSTHDYLLHDLSDTAESLGIELKKPANTAEITNTADAKVEATETAENTVTETVDNTKVIDTSNAAPVETATILAFPLPKATQPAPGAAPLAGFTNPGGTRIPGQMNMAAAPETGSGFGGLTTPVAREGADIAKEFRTTLGTEFKNLEGQITDILSGNVDNAAPATTVDEVISGFLAKLDETRTAIKQSSTYPDSIKEDLISDLGSFEVALSNPDIRRGQTTRFDADGNPIEITLDNTPQSAELPEGVTFSDGKPVEPDATATLGTTLTPDNVTVTASTVANMPPPAALIQRFGPDVGGADNVDVTFTNILREGEASKPTEVTVDEIPQAKLPEGVTIAEEPKPVKKATEATKTRRAGKTNNHYKDNFKAPLVAALKKFKEADDLVAAKVEYDQTIAALNNQFGPTTDKNTQFAESAQKDWKASVARSNEAVENNLELRTQNSDTSTTVNETPAPIGTEGTAPQPSSGEAANSIRTAVITAVSKAKRTAGENGYKAARAELEEGLTLILNSVSDQNSDFGFSMSERAMLIEDIDADLSNMDALLRGQQSANSHTLNGANTRGVANNTIDPNTQNNGAGNAQNNGNGADKTTKVEEPKIEAESKAEDKPKIEDEPNTKDETPEDVTEKAPKVPKAVEDAYVWLSNFRPWKARARSRAFSKVVRDFSSNMGKDWTALADGLKNSRNFGADRTKLVKQFRDHIDTLEKTLKKATITQEHDANFRRYTSDFGQLTPVQQAAIQMDLNRMKELAKEVEAFSSKSDFMTFFTKSMERIATKGETPLKLEDLLYASTRKVGEPDKPVIGINVPETWKRRVDMLERRHTHGMDSQSADMRQFAETGNKENIAHKDVFTMLDEINKEGLTSDTVVDKASDALWVAYRTGLEVDLLNDIERALMSKGQNTTITQSRPIQYFPQVIEGLKKRALSDPEYVAFLNDPATPGYIDADGKIQDDHFVDNFIERLRYEEKNNWRKEPSGTEASWKTWLFGMHLDGEDFSRRSQRARYQADTHIKLIKDQFRDKGGNGKNGKDANGWTDAYRRYFNTRKEPFKKGAERTWGYLSGKHEDYAAYREDAGRYASPDKYDVKFKGADKDTGKIAKAFGVVRRPTTILWRASGLGLPELALRNVPSHWMWGYADYLQARNVLYAARVGTIYGAAAAIENWTEEDSILRHHPANYLDDAISKVAYEGSGLLVNTASGIVSLPSGLTGYDPDWGWGVTQGDYSSLTGKPNNSPSVQTQDNNDEETTPENPDAKFATSKEADLIRVWAERKQPKPPGADTGWVETDAEETYKNRIINRAAKLLQKNPSLYPHYSDGNPLNNFDAVWVDAKKEIDIEDRENNIKTALIEYYKNERGSNYNAAGDANSDYHTILPWLIADPRIGQNPVYDDATRMAFIGQVHRHIISITPAAVATRFRAAEAAYISMAVASGGRTPPSLTKTEKLAAALIADKRSDNNVTFLIPLKFDANGMPVVDANGQPVVDAAYLATPEGQTLLTETLEEAENKIKIAEEKRIVEERTTSARVGLNLWMKDNTPAAFAKLKIADNQDKLEEGVAIALAKSSFTEEQLRNPDNAAVSAVRKDAMDQAIAAFIAKNDLDKDGDVDAKDRKLKERNENGNYKPGKDLSLTWDETKSSLSNAFNTLTDIDGDGYSAFIQRDWGRSISGTVQLAGGALGDMFGNLSNTKDGQQVLGIGAGIFAALALPSIARRIPILKHIANIPVVGGLLFAALGFFLAAKGVNSYFTGDSLFAEGEGDGDDGDAQGDGTHIQRGEGFKVRVNTQGHTGDIPQIITLETDVDGDGVKETVNFFNTDGDDLWAGQVVSPDGTETYAVPEFLTRDKMQGLMNFASPDAASSKATLKEGKTIQIELTDHDATTGKPTKSKLTVNDNVFELGIHDINDGLVHDKDLKTMEPAEQ